MFDKASCLLEFGGFVQLELANFLLSFAENIFSFAEIFSAFAEKNLSVAKTISSVARKISTTEEIVFSVEKLTKTTDLSNFGHTSARSENKYPRSCVIETT